MGSNTPHALTVTLTSGVPRSAVKASGIGCRMAETQASSPPAMTQTAPTGIKRRRINPFRAAALTLRGAPGWRDLHPLGAAYLADGPVRPQEELRGAQLPVVVGAHGPSVGSGIVDDDQVASSTFGRARSIANLSLFSHSDPVTS